MKSPLLRTTVFSFIFVLSSLTLRSQWVSIPDTNFGTWLNTNGYSACMQGNNGVGWQMDTTCPSIVNETTVNCGYKDIRDLTGIEYFDGLEELICIYNLLTNLPAALPAGISNLDCSHNVLTGLPALPAGLAYFDCSYNSLSSLPPLPTWLLALACGFNQLTALPTLPATLTYWLYCPDNLLTALPALPAVLTSITCSNNPIGALPQLPPALEGLLCDNNQLSSLPALPAGLTSLWCYSNQLTNLPALPATVFWLRCESNQLSSLPALPPALQILSCGSNQLTGLPALPAGLNELICPYNQLSSLPALPTANFYQFICSYNQLTSIPELPDTLSNFHCGNNPNLYCLPLLKHVAYFSFDSTGITCLPSYPQGNISSNPALSSVPLCDVFNNNSCSVFWNISGSAYYDDNSNCLNDSSDVSQLNVKMQLWNNGNLLQQVFTGSEGFYSFDTDSLTGYEVSVDTTATPFYVSCPSNNLLYDTLTTTDSLHYNRDFALECKPGFDLTAHSLWALVFRPARFTTIHVDAGDYSNFYGVQCAAGVSGVVTIAITGAVSYVSPASGALIPGVSGNTLTYTIADFGAVNFFSDFDFIVQTDTNAVLGSQVCFTVSVTPTAGDNNPSNNMLTQCFTVVGSFDPNDKQVYPSGDIDTTQEWLTYTINFQNTGTDTAIHVYITDTLDSDLDYSTFQLLAYSHRPNVQIKENAVRFNFPNINLPDSNVNEPQSHGYVQYKIKIKDGSTIGTQINNTAFIYFDFNAPVVTNTTTNTIALISGIPSVSVQQYKIQVYPNPATNELYISGAQADGIKIYNTTGSMLLDIPKPQNNRLDISTLPKGVYIAEVTAKGETQRLRWVKM